MFTTTATINSSPIVHLCTEGENGINGTACKKDTRRSAVWRSEDVNTKATCKSCIKIAG